MAKIEKTNITDQIFDYMKEQIITGQWTEGNKIPSENNLAEQLGVSRMSLRVAIQKSNVLGLTETRIGEGTFVCEFSMASYFRELFNSNLLSNNINEINDFRMILQIGSIRLAFELDNLESRVSQLEDIYDNMVSASEENDLEQFHEADKEFHRCIMSLSENSYMALLYDAIFQFIDKSSQENVRHSIESAGTFEHILNFHKTILDGVKEKNLDKCIGAELDSRKRALTYYPKES